MAYTQVYESVSGGWVWQHELHLQSELQENLEAAKILADHGYKIELLPYLSANAGSLRNLLVLDVFATKNPDIRINHLLIGDIKTPSIKHAINKSSISRSISNAAKQKVQAVIINLNGRDYFIRDIVNGIVGALQPERNKSIETVWIITKTETLFIVDRKSVFNEEMYKELD